MQACLDEKQLLDLTYGTSTEEFRRAAEEHADTCERCRELLDSTTERITWTGDEPRTSDPSVVPPAPKPVPLPKPGELAKKAFATGAKLDPKALVDALRSAGYPVRPTRGTTIGRYIVIDRMVERSTDALYSAYDADEDRKVVLRLIQIPADVGSKDKEPPWVRELRIASTLRHPNVVSLWDVGWEQDRVVVASEFVRGETLGAWLREEKRPWQDVVTVFVAAGRGLAAAHAANVVHGNFKLSDVFMGERGRARVADFGLARAMGVAHSMTPGDDQVRYCALLYEALFGEPPFDESAMERGEPREPPAVAGVPDRVKRAILRGLAAAPEDRFPSMEALLSEFDAPSRRRWMWAMAAFVLIAIGMAVVFVVDRVFR